MKARSILASGAAGLAGVATYDLLQREHALMHNFPVVGHLRYLLERIGPELRQYIVTSNDEERPFSRDQRAWIYTSSKKLNNYFGFGTDNDVENLVGYPVLKHRTFVVPRASTADAHVADRGAGPSKRQTVLPSAKVLGGPRGRAGAFRPESLVNVSAMSFGSLSGAAIESLNAGAALAGCLHNTGEGGLSSHHRNGGGLILQIGTAYFGCRDENGRFDLARLKDVVASAPVKAVEIKLSQGAKPGLGGLLPKAKITDEIAQIRGIPHDRDCASPSRHTAFHDVDSMLDFVELLAAETGLPVGIKSAVGHLDFWEDLVRQMADRWRGVDFVTVDGGEGGTGAAPLVFSDAVALPFRLGFSRVYSLFASAGLTDELTFIGSGKLGVPENALVALCLGADMVNVAREAMMSIGCIQAQKCHTDKCPTGIATQSAWLAKGIDPQQKSVRLANYVDALRGELLHIAQACGYDHPALLGPDDIELMDGTRHGKPLAEVFGYEAGWGVPGDRVLTELYRVLDGASGQG